MIDLQSPNRQSKLAILLYLAKKLRALFFMAIYLIGTWGGYMGNSYLYYGVIAFAVITLISPIIDWYYFIFYRQEDKLILERGLLNKKRQEIPFSRIQNINITQSLIQRVLGLASLEVDTAGSSEKEFEIIGLERQKAYKLKDLLDMNTTDTQEQAGEQQVESNAPPQEKTVLVKLSTAQLLKVGLTQNHLKSGFVALGLVIGFWYKIKDVVEWFYEDALNLDVEQLVQGATMGLLLGALIAFIISSVLVSLVTVFVKYYDFKAVLYKSNLEISMGLLTRKEFKIPISKIQIIEFHTNPLRELLGYKTAKIFQVISQDTSGKSSNRSISIPACLPDQQRLLQEKIFGYGIADDCRTAQPVVRSYVLITLSILALPCLALAVAGYLYLYSPWLWPVVSIVILTVSGLLAERYARHCKISIDSNLLVIYKGWIFRKTLLTPYYRAQAVGWMQSIFIRRRRLGHFEIHMAAGKRMMRYLNMLHIQEFTDRINNTVIRSNQEWM